MEVFKPLPRSFSASSALPPLIPLPGPAFKQFCWKGIGRSEKICTTFHRVCNGTRPPHPIPQNHSSDDDCRGAGWLSCYPILLKLCITYCCVLAAGQRSSASKADRLDKTRPKRKKNNRNRKNNNLEDKGGRGDRLSPVGILNHCGFNTPPQPVHSDFEQSINPSCGYNILSQNVVVVVVEVVVDSSWSSHLGDKNPFHRS